MTRKTVVTCVMLTLCTSAGAAALYASSRWSSLEMPTLAWQSNYVRIELPAVEVVDADKFTELDIAILSGEAVDGTAPQAALESGSHVGDDAAPAVETLSHEAVRVAQTAEETRLDGLLAVSFNLAQADVSDRAPLELRKGVRFNGADAGQATIRVGTGSALFIASEDLRTLLSGAQRVDLVERLAADAGQAFVGFDEVRQQGLNLRYDAAADQILISG